MPLARGMSVPEEDQPDRVLLVHELGVVLAGLHSSNTPLFELFCIYSPLSFVSPRHRNGAGDLAAAVTRPCDASSPVPFDFG